jgi:CRP-like cAMP-binding protein
MSHREPPEPPSFSVMTVETDSLRTGGPDAPDPMAVFAPVRSLDVRSLAGPALEVPVSAGSRLIDEGSVVGTFFVIRAGQAELWQAGRRLRLLGIGDCFGEIDPAAAAGQPYTVIAATPMRVLTFSAFGIARLCASEPSLRARILSFLPAA